ncbi:hypothetical protein JCM10212_001259 [Sporobolomyces blumeae]
MSSDWADLKAKRGNKQLRTIATRPHAGNSTSEPTPDQADERIVDPRRRTSLVRHLHAAADGRRSTPAEPASNVQESVDFNHADLPSTVKVERLAGRGRAIVARKEFAPGDPILGTRPLVSVLDSNNVQHRCSMCYKLPSDAKTGKDELLRCSLCRIVRYCSPACQKADWRVHKMECKALRQVQGTKIPDNADPSVYRRAKDGPRLPDTPIRALGRLLWLNELEGSDVWKQIESLESHRTRLDQAQQEQYFKLSVALSMYVGQEFLAKACPDAAALIDLCSRFVSNSFSLTSPTDSSNIGVSISPVTALFNHSCRPNAVVVFPFWPKPADPSWKTMTVVALRPIKPGQEITTSYIDTSVPRAMRQADLKQRYKFECDCAECADEARGDKPNPRSAHVCTKNKCDGLIPSIKGGGMSECSVCHTKAKVPDIASMIAACKIGWERAQELSLTGTLSDHPEEAIHGCVSIIATFAMIEPPVAPSTYPLYQAYCFIPMYALQKNDYELAGEPTYFAWRGSTLLYPWGHPIRAVWSTTLAGLHAHCPTTPGLSPEAQHQADLAFWLDGPARNRAKLMLAEARKEVDLAFGDVAQQPDSRRINRDFSVASTALWMVCQDYTESQEVARRMMPPDFDLNSFLASYGGMPAPYGGANGAARQGGDGNAAQESGGSIDPSKTNWHPPTALRASSHGSYGLQNAPAYSSQALEGQILSAAGPSRSALSNHSAASKSAGAGGGGGAGTDAMSEGSSTATTNRRNSTNPYARVDGIQQKQPKSSSTTALFNTRKNWSQYILESIEDFMHVVTIDGKFIFASQSIDTLCGFDPEELRGQSLFSFLHPSDVEPFRREFLSCLSASSADPTAKHPERLTAHYRFRTKDDRYVLFEITGHFFSAQTTTPSSTPASSVSSSSNGHSHSSTSTKPKCFFGLARPYPSRSVAMLDSFLELKMENERLRQELLVLYEEIEGDSSLTSPTAQNQITPATSDTHPVSLSAAYPPRGDLFDARTSTSVIDPSTGLIRTSELIPSTSNTYGALGIGISANGKKGDGQSEKRRKQKQKADGDSDLVCRDCGRTDSPEWRKGPDGPKTLCNACGLRYAKLKSRLDKQASGALPGKKARV